MEKMVMRMSIARQSREFSQEVKERGYPKNENWDAYRKNKQKESIDNSQQLRGLGSSLRNWYYRQYNNLQSDYNYWIIKQPSQFELYPEMNQLLWLFLSSEGYFHASLSPCCDAFLVYYFSSLFLLPLFLSFASIIGLLYFQSSFCSSLCFHCAFVNFIW